MRWKPSVIPKVFFLRATILFLELSLHSSSAFVPRSANAIFADPTCNSLARYHFGTNTNHPHSPLLFVSPLDGDDKNVDDSQSILSQRIRQLQEKENREALASNQALSARFQELQKSETTDLILQSGSAQVMNLPVLSFDSLLPQQTIAGRTEDPTFCVFLRELGLGGWFVMTSLDPTTRKIRRHGVLVKIVAIDALKNKDASSSKTLAKPTTTTTTTTTTDHLTSIPTAVDFQLVGRSRCRILSKHRQGMKKRIGRWRRCHDPNGEGAVLGWGDERFVDASPDLNLNLDLESSNTNPNINEGDSSIDQDWAKLSSSEWNMLPVLVNLEALETPDEEQSHAHQQEKVNELSLLVDEWYNLASNVNTYNNINVTATTRIRHGHPGLWVEPDKLLARVAKQLGPRPTEPTAFCFWAAAMINPLPSLGVSMEIRGRLLEAVTVERRLEILEVGLRRSIENLTGRRPLL